MYREDDKDDFFQKEKARKTFILRAFFILGLSILIKFLQIIGVQFGDQSGDFKFGHLIPLLLLVIQRVV